MNIPKQYAAVAEITIDLTYEPLIDLIVEVVDTRIAASSNQYTASERINEIKALSQDCFNAKAQGGTTVSYKIVVNTTSPEKMKTLFKEAGNKLIN